MRMNTCIKTTMKNITLFIIMFALSLLWVALCMKAYIYMPVENCSTMDSFLYRQNTVFRYHENFPDFSWIECEPALWITKLFVYVVIVPIMFMTNYMISKSLSEYFVVVLVTTALWNAL